MCSAHATGADSPGSTTISKIYFTCPNLEVICLLVGSVLHSSAVHFPTLNLPLLHSKEENTQILENDSAIIFNLVTFEFTAAIYSESCLLNA